MCIFRRYHYKTLDSTSAFIKRRRSLMRNFTFVSADYQTAGRGRIGRRWESAAKQNLTFSVLIKDKALVEKFGLISVGSAVAVMNVLKSFGVSGVSVKWPNDVYVNGKKICGILLDGITLNGALGEVVVGIGLNVNQTDFGTELSNATSVKNELLADVDLKKIKSSVYKELYRVLTSLKESNRCISEAQNNDFLKGKKVYCELDGVKKEVEALGINLEGTLKIRDGEIVREVNTGEITFHLGE